MILITGASQGIGHACAKIVLAETTSDVMITGRTEGSLRRAQDAVPASQRDRLLLRTCDQGDPTDVRALRALLADPDTALEAAILCVGVNPMYTEGPRRLHALSEETIDATIRTNCTHTLLLSTAILERFRRQGSGVLIWIGSRAYKVGLPGAGIYCATKAFLSGLANTAHHEYASRGVRVHLVNPGLVRTPRTAGVVDRFGSRHGIAIDDAMAVAGRITALLRAGASSAAEVDL